MKTARLLTGLAAALLVSVPFAHAQKVPPKPIEITSPGYPEELTDTGRSGTATVAFTVKADGSVADPVVNAADNPAFGTAVVAALTKWKFQPGTQDGQPVDMRVAQQFKFTPPPEQMMNVIAGRKLFMKLNQPVLAEKDFGAKLTPKQQLRPVYPKELVGSKKKGAVRVSFVITPEGNVVNPVILGEALDPFVVPALMTAGGLTFAPPMKDGKPVYVASETMLIFDENPSPARGGIRGRGGRGGGGGGGADFGAGVGGDFGGGASGGASPGGSPD